MAPMMPATKVPKSAAVAVAETGVSQHTARGGISRAPPLRTLLSDAGPEDLRLVRRQVEREGRRGENSEQIFLKSSSDIDVFRTRDVEWIEADGDYVKFHIAGRSYLVRGTMAALEAWLDPTRFVRIHRCIVINVDHLRRIRTSFDEDYGVILFDGTKLRVSKGYLCRLRSVIEKGTPFRKQCAQP